MNHVFQINANLITRDNVIVGEIANLDYGFGKKVRSATGLSPVLHKGTLRLHVFMGGADDYQKIDRSDLDNARNANAFDFEIGTDLMEFLKSATWDIADTDPKWCCLVDYDPRWESCHVAVQ